MTPKGVDKAVTALIGLILAVAPQPAYPGEPSGPGGAADSAPMSSNELNGLVAPIALYPDPLVAQILAGATFPDQVAVADYWLQQNKSLHGETLVQAVDKQSWDAGVKALTQFPSVLHNMARNLGWTSALGEAYHNQSYEVMSAIQRMRAQAKVAGNLKSGPRITVTQPSPQIIALEPANPQIVYVPQYNPAVIYGTPYVTPGYTASGPLLGFGAGVAVGALAGGGCCGWGWGSWNTNWRTGAAVYNHNSFYGNSAWHGTYYNGAYHDGYGYHNAYGHAAANYRGSANREEDWNRNITPPIERGLSLGGDSWAHNDNAFRTWNAFSGFDNRSAGAGDFGWQSRAQSLRGWGSMRAGGFFGGRFGGRHFGGGGFRGGGFRR